MANDDGVITLEAMALTAVNNPVSAPKPAYTPPVATEVADTVALSKTYRDTVLQLLNDGKVQEALALRESAGQMYSDLQAAFSALYKGAPVGNTIENIASNPKVIDQRLSQAYQQQLSISSVNLPTSRRER